MWLLKRDTIYDTIKVIHVFLPPPATDNCVGEQVLDCDLRDAILTTRQADK